MRAPRGLVHALVASTLGCATAGPPALPPTPAAEVRSARLRVRFEGVRAGEGRLACALFGNQASFEDDDSPLRSAVLPLDDLEDEVAEWSLDLPHGGYAVNWAHIYYNNYVWNMGIGHMPR